MVLVPDLTSYEVRPPTTPLRKVGLFVGKPIINGGVIGHVDRIDDVQLNLHSKRIPFVDNASHFQISRGLPYTKLLLLFPESVYLCT